MKQDSGNDMLLENELKSEVNRWIKLLKRIIDVVIFLGERGLPFRESTQIIHDVHNGNFLEILELIAHYDPVLRRILKKFMILKREKNACKSTIFLATLRMNVLTSAQMK